MKPLRLHLSASASLMFVLTASLPWCGAHAGGFALSEMSAAGLGNAHAGGAASSEDLSTIYFNPAGLTRFSGREFMASGAALQTSSKFQNQGSLSGAGTPLTGGNGGDAGVLAFVPALYYAMDIDARTRFGIGLQSPFGLETNYDGGWAGRYQALKSALRSVEISPVLAYRVSDQLSLGGGLSARYVDVELTRAIDFGTACVGALGVATCAGGGFLPQARDGRAKVTGDDWGFGYNLGVLYELSPNARIGASYRSKVTYKLKGDIRFDRPAGLPGPLAASRSFADAGARADVTLPESINISGYLDLDPKWSVMADVNWVRWSRFDELRIRFDSGAPDNVTPERWRNTTRVAIAANYHYNDQWMLRGGVAYDPTPVPDRYRTPRIPDNDRIWLALGAQFKPTRTSAVDIGYAHLFVKDASLDIADPPLGGRLTGNYDNRVDILSIQYRQSF